MTFVVRRYSTCKTVDLLIKCGADVDAFDAQRNSPLHIVAQRTDNIHDVLLTIDLLCRKAGAHLDYVNECGKTPVECASHGDVKTRLRERIRVGRLKCLCARLIRREKGCLVNGWYPAALKHFVDKH
jgi:hypothetical protein